MAGLINALTYRNVRASAGDGGLRKSLPGAWSSAPVDLNGVAVWDANVAYVQGPSGQSAAVVPLAAGSEGDGHALSSSTTSCSVGGAISDIVFSPISRTPLLALSSAEGKETRLWTIKSDTCAATEIATFSGAGCGSLSFHPSVASLVATGGENVVQIWDCVQPGTPALTVELPAGAAIKDLSWSGAGEALAAVDSKGFLHLLDPRSDALSQSISAHTKGILRVAWDLSVESSGLLVTTGASVMQEREMALWDGRKLEKPVKLFRIGGPAGGKALEPFTTCNTGLLFLCGRGDANISMFELSQGALHPLPKASVGSEGGIWHALGPMQACDHSNAEVAHLHRVFRDGRAQVLKIDVPRKDRSRIHEELYPPIPTRSQDACADEWLGGGESIPPALAPAFAQVAGATNSCHRSGGSQPVGTTPVVEEPAAPPAIEHVVSSEVLQAEAESEARTARFRISTTSKYKHVYGEEWPPSELQTGLRPDLSAVDSAGFLACSALHWAVPWSGGGGPVYVGRHGRGCGTKIEPAAACLNGQKGPVRGVDFSPFDPSLLATGSEDSTVLLWKVPSSGITGDESPTACIRGNTHGVKQVSWHPQVKDVLMVATGSGASNASVRVFNAPTGQQLSYHEHPAPINHVCFSSCGSFVASTCKDSKVRIFSARDGSPIAESDGSTGGPRQLCAWYSRSGIDLLISTGFGMASLRQMYVWDPRNLGTPVSTTSMDYANGVLLPLVSEAVGIIYLAAKGDRNIKCYEMIGPTPSAANEFRAAGGPLTGVALIPPGPSTLDVMNCEVSRLLRLGADGFLQPVSFILPRAAELKSFFQDDVYGPVRKCPASVASPESQVEAWVAGEPVLAEMHSLMPEGVMPLSEKPETPRTVSKTARWRQQMEQDKEEEKLKDNEFARLTALANQNAAYNPNLSMGRAAGVDEAVIDQGEVSDSEWDD